MRLSGEDALLAWLRRQLGPRSPLGDDAAFLEPRGRLAITVDQQIEGTHFPLGLDPARVARRLLAVNLSDLAACGARPEWAFLALAAPAGFDHRRFLRALVRACRSAGVVLAGGDLARGPLLSASLTLIGSRRPRGRWLRRDGARPGERLWVGGTLGESALGRELLARSAASASGGSIDVASSATAGATRVAGLRVAARRAVRRHLEPQPQLELGAWLARQPRGAAIDLSDGLARDLRRLCRQSGVGAVLEAAALPQAPRAAELATRLDLDPLGLALGGGEDYVLLFTLPRASAPPPRFGCHAIGRIVRGADVQLVERNGSRPLPDLGWDHLRGDAELAFSALRSRAAH